MDCIGHDAKGETVKPREHWEQQKDTDGTHTSWYKSAVEYWDKQEASYNGVLGGYGHVHDTDIRDSRNLLLKAFKKQLAEAELNGNTLCAIGAGVGRVTEELLIKHFKTVDVLEPSKHLIETARAKLTGSASKAFPPGHEVDAFYTQGLETWTPPAARYDCIWVQWCLLYLTDDDCVSFFARASAGLKPGGAFFVKENVCANGFVVDEEDCSLTRSNAYLMELFKNCNMSVVYNVKQKSFPDELFDVRMYVLRPRTS